MNKLAAYEMLLEEHPLWNKEAGEMQDLAMLDAARGARLRQRLRDTEEGDAAAGSMSTPARLGLGGAVTGLGAGAGALLAPKVLPMLSRQKGALGGAAAGLMGVGLSELGRRRRDKLRAAFAEHSLE